jgi:hypothetical protein
MSVITRAEIETAFKRLGELALQCHTSIELIVLGGTAMIFAFQARQSTHDVDVVIVKPTPARLARELAIQVAEEMQWQDDWLNDGAKGYLHGYKDGGIVFTAPGITVRRPVTEQLLAMKLSAWRDDVDIADSRKLLQALMDTAESEDMHEHIWQQIEPYLVPGNELKAQYAFEDLWETHHG